MEVIIERADNGYIILSDSNMEEGSDRKYKDVFEDCGDFQEVESFIKAVWFLAEYFGVLGSKHDEKRFWVGMIPRDCNCSEETLNRMEKCPKHSCIDS